MKLSRWNTSQNVLLWITQECSLTAVIIPLSVLITDNLIYQENLQAVLQEVTRFSTWSSSHTLVWAILPGKQTVWWMKRRWIQLSKEGTLITWVCGSNTLSFKITKKRYVLCFRNVISFVDSFWKSVILHEYSSHFKMNCLLCISIWCHIFHLYLLWFNILILAWFQWETAEGLWLGRRFLRFLKGRTWRSYI